MPPEENVMFIGDGVTIEDRSFEWTPSQVEEFLEKLRGEDFND